MFLLPYRKIVIESPLTKDIALERISLAVDPDGWLFHCNRAFYGSLLKDGFRLMSAPEARKWTPLLCGRVEPNDVASKVEVTFSWPLLAILYGVLGLFVIPVWGELSKGASLARSLATGTLALLGLHLLTYLLGFHPGVVEAERLLRDLLGVYD